jgi:hypothetical protein
MPNSENDHAVELEILKQRLENHREYVSRQWQYYATFILLNGLIINAVKDLSITASLAVRVLAMAFVISSGVFFYLVRWTNMRIQRNAAKTNELAQKLATQNLIEIPRTSEGITPWMLVSIVAFTVCWLIWLFSFSTKIGVLSVFLFVVIVVNSLLSTKRSDQGDAQ